MKRNLLLVAALLTAILVRAQGQTPETLFVGQVVVGPKRTETLYAHTMGQWSDADENLGVPSVEIHCYERFGFCEEADATYYFGRAGVTLTTFDILRWDERELIAVDSSPICVVNTLRFEFVSKKVTITASLKGETKDPFCKNMKATTAFLGGVDDQIKKDLKKKNK